MEKIELKVTMKNRLRALMADEGFRSMAVLSEETGISKNMLYMFERGESSLGADNICKLLWALDCKFEDLIQYEVESNEPDTWDALTEETQAEIQQAKREYHSKSKRRAS